MMCVPELLFARATPRTSRDAKALRWSGVKPNVRKERVTYAYGRADIPNADAFCERPEFVRCREIAGARMGSFTIASMPLMFLVESDLIHASREEKR